MRDQASAAHYRSDRRVKFPNRVIAGTERVRPPLSSGLSPDHPVVRDRGDGITPSR